MPFTCFRLLPVHEENVHRCLANNQMNDIRCFEYERHDPQDFEDILC